MQNILTYAQIVLSVALVGVILLQQRGSSLGGSFGGDSSSYTSRRGIEKTFFRATIVIGILFFSTAIAALFLR
jgi:protein translocase SecG subunit